MEVVLLLKVFPNFLVSSHLPIVRWQTAVEIARILPESFIGINVLFHQGYGKKAVPYLHTVVVPVLALVVELAGGGSTQQLLVLMPMPFQRLAPYVLTQMFLQETQTGPTHLKTKRKVVWSVSMNWRRQSQAV